MSEELQIAVLAFILSALYSGSEAAFYAAHPLKIQVLKRRDVARAELVSHYLENPQQYLSTILIGNNIANILFGSFLAVYLSQFYNEFIVSIISSLTILFFAEILPKSIMRVIAIQASLRLVIFVKASEFLFYPVIRGITGLISFFSQLFHVDMGQNEDRPSREEIQFLFRESRYLGQIDMEGEEIIRRIMRLSETKARQIMVPRTEVVAIADDKPIEAIRQTFLRVPFSRLPVYHRSLDHIIGVVHVFDLFQHPKSLQEILRPVIFVPETLPVFKLLKQLQGRKSTLAVVFDEYGGTSGIVTIEDVVEEIFGEFADEYDASGTMIQKLSPKEYIVRGRVDLGMLSRELGIELPPGDYDTLAGYIIHELGHIPKPGETVELDRCKLEVSQADKTKVDFVRVLIKQETKKEENESIRNGTGAKSA